jgi:hypothetical protein
VIDVVRGGMELLLNNRRWELVLNHSRATGQSIYAGSCSLLSSPKDAPTPLLSTPGAAECHAVPQGTKCGANRAHGHVRELGLEEGRGKDSGPGPKAEQRLSRCMALTQKQQISD